ncbi:MAG: hypothetical protein ACI9U2_002365 [Bradymonadia bacterium]|jgi:hypothetical protein
MFPFDPDNNKKAESKSDRLILYGFVLLFGGLMVAEILNAFSVAKLGFFFFAGAVIGLTVLHEFGHAYMARAFGWRVYEIVIGFGPVIKTWRWGKARVELKAWPLGGHVLPVPPDARQRRLAQFFIYAAGPGIELAVVGVLALIVGVDTLLSSSDSVTVIAAQSVCAAAIWGTITNLFPMTTADGAVTDGLGMLRSAFMKPDDFSRQLASPYLVEGHRRLSAVNGLGAREVFESGIEQYPNVAALHVGRFRALEMLGERTEGLMYLQTASTDTKRSAQCRAELKDFIAHVRREAEIASTFE